MIRRLRHHEARKCADLAFGAQHPRPQKGSSFTGSPYLYADHVEDYWEKLENRARICRPRPIETFDYGMREFVVYDDNDYVIQLSQNSTGR